MGEVLLISLGMTLALELGYAWLWGVSNKDYFVVFWMNVLTNPLVVLWHYTFYDLGIWINTVAPELAAVFVEIVAVTFLARNINKPVHFAICVNIFSYFTGIFLNQFLF